VTALGGMGEAMRPEAKEWAAVSPRHIKGEQWERFEGYLLARELRCRPPAPSRVLRLVRPERVSEVVTSLADGALEPLELLYEAGQLPSSGLAPGLVAAYGGELGLLGSPCLYANFVSSLDGVVALGPEYRSSGSAISGRAPADRFVMALLRALADAVLIGAGTLRATPAHRWTADHVWPQGSGQFAQLRRRFGRQRFPELVVVSGRGDVPVTHPAIEAGALIATTPEGARQLEDRVPPACTVLTLGAGPRLKMAEVLTVLRERGHRAVLTEGGPGLLGHLVEEGLLDELFLTVSPVLAGRAATARPGLVSGVELLPCCPNPAELLSVRRRGSYLFLRYGFGRQPLGLGATG
jgi:riboflavin biosynthesis pyrimidine reductase